MRIASTGVTSLAAATVCLAASAAPFARTVAVQAEKRGSCTVEALGSGQDNGPNIHKAFSECNKNSVIDLPGNYTVGTALNTTGLHNANISLTGQITYTPNITYWSPASFYLTYQNATTAWLLGGENIVLSGGGAIDGNGLIWWEAYATNPNAGVAGGSSLTFARPIPLTVYQSTNVVVRNITIQNSPFWHNFIYESTNVLYDGITIHSVSSNGSAPAVNTDGWDTYRSSYVTFQNSHVYNHDDCVALRPNSTYVQVDNIYCSGSHGISIGCMSFCAPLGQYAGETDIVANVQVTNIQLYSSHYGARIKVFGGSNDSMSISGGGTGYVRNVTFEHFYIDGAVSPIVLTQCYDTSTEQCEEFPAQLTIDDIHYVNITGTASSGSEGIIVSLECSNTCDDITAKDINITVSGYTPIYQCANLADESLLDFNCTNVTI